MDDRPLPVTRNLVPPKPMPSPWEEPIPLSHTDVPPFPVEALTGWLRDFVEAEAIATQTPPDLTALLALSVCGFACSKKAIVEVKAGYVEPLNIFTVIALAPGNRKSAVFRDATAPLDEAEREEAARLAPEVALSRSKYRVAQEALRRAEMRAAKNAGASEDAVEEVARLSNELLGMKSLATPRFVVEDCSPERLATILAEQEGRIAVMAPEGDVFDLMAGRYSATGTANFGNFLKGHAGDDIRVDRVGRPSDYVSKPALTVGLAVQPEVIRGLMQKPGFLGRGLLARFLYSTPVSLLGRREIDAEGVAVSVREAYRRGVLDLIALPLRRDERGEIVPHVLRFEQDALELLRDFEGWLEPQLAEFGELGHMSDWAGKLVGAIVRIVGILRLAEHPEISGENGIWIGRALVERGIQIGRYLISHARAAYGEMGADPLVAEATHVLGWITGQDRDSFTKRDAFTAMKGRFRKVGMMEPALSLLIEHSYIRVRSEDAVQGPGRKPSPVYEINPALLAQNSHNPQNRSHRNLQSDSADCAGALTLISAPIVSGVTR
ncbi:MAG: YfjI family protein [Candidatus Eisenbacteria bacterium]